MRALGGLLLLLLLGPTRDGRAASSYSIDASGTNSMAWKKMMRHFRERTPLLGDGAQQTLIRIRLEGGDRKELIQADAGTGGVLDPPGPPQCGRGRGQFMRLEDGEFFMFDHLYAGGRSNGYDVIHVASMRRRADVRLPCPAPGALVALGDLVLPEAPTSSLGSLRVVLSGSNPSAISGYSLTIGPLVAGGAYGDTVRFKRGRCEFDRLPAGTYKIVVPDRDPVRHRWTVLVEAGHHTEVQLFAGAEGEIALGETKVTPE